MNPILEFRQVGRAYDSPNGLKSVLHDINLSIFSGQFSAITGPSGSGKSTFLNLCALLDEPTQGEIFFEGMAISGLSETLLCALRKKAVGMVFQHYCLLPYRTVLENVMFRFRYLDMDNAEVQTLAREALAMVGLKGFEDRSTNQLSGGEMQRVGIARAIALRPRLLVADEPTGNLDLEAATQVMECLQKIGEQDDIAILLVTHDESLLQYTTRHLLCHDGLLTDFA